MYKDCQTDTQYAYHNGDLYSQIADGTLGAKARLIRLLHLPDAIVRASRLESHVIGTLAQNGGGLARVHSLRDRPKPSRSLQIVRRVHLYLLSHGEIKSENGGELRKIEVNAEDILVNGDQAATGTGMHADDAPFDRLIDRDTGAPP